jgi:hypothetical protein
MMVIPNRPVRPFQKSVLTYIASRTLSTKAKNALQWLFTEKLILAVCRKVNRHLSSA